MDVFNIKVFSSLINAFKAIAKDISMPRQKNSIEILVKLFSFFDSRVTNFKRTMYCIVVKYALNNGLN